MLPSTIAAAAIELRRFDEAHVEQMVVAMDASLPELSPWFPWAGSPPDRQVQRERARAARAAFRAGTDFEFSLLEVRTGDLVGGFRINPRADRHVAELGYWVRSDRHRRGYATQAVRAATSAVFDTLPDIQLVQIKMDPTNTPSASVASAAGFTFLREIDRPPMAPAHTGSALVWGVGVSEWRTM